MKLDGSDAMPARASSAPPMCAAVSTDERRTGRYGRANASSRHRRAHDPPSPDLLQRERRSLMLAGVLTSALLPLPQAAVMLPGVNLGFDQATFERAQVLR